MTTRAPAGSHQQAGSASFELEPAAASGESSGLVGEGGVRWLIAEYCGHDIFMGWHLYLRDDPGYQKRNKDGDWGWLRGPVWERDRAGNKIVAFFAAAFEIDLQGDWSCGRYGLAEFVSRFPLPGRKVWGERRGGVRVIEGYWGDLTLAPLGGGGAELVTKDARRQKGKTQNDKLSDCGETERTQ